MRILHIISSLEIGGAQKLVHDLALSQINTGSDVSVLVYFSCDSMFEKDLIKAGVNIISLNCKNSKSLLLPIKLRHVLKDYDVTHVHLFPALYQAALASVGIKTPLVYTEHSTYNRRRAKKYLRPLEQLVYSRYSQIISISEQTQNALFQWLKPRATSKFQTIHNGVNLGKYHKAEAKNPKDTFGRAGIPILMVSRFVPAKDQATLIKALKFIENSNVFVAFAGDGELIQDAKKLAEEVGVSERCVFLGSRNDIPELIKSSAIGVQSSHWEGFGLTAVEFMAAGKPVIASSVDGLKQVVDGAGILFNPGDEQQLAKNITQLTTDNILYSDISAKCLNRAEKYSLESTAKQYYDAYNNIVRY